MKASRFVLPTVLALSAGVYATALAEPADGGGPQLGVEPYRNDIGLPYTFARVGRLPAPPAGKAQVVFFQPKSLTGRKVAIHDESQTVAQLKTGTYAVVLVIPGQRTFRPGSSVDALSLELQPGRTYYVRQTVGMFSPGAHLDLSDEAEFRSLSSRPAG